MIIGRLSLLKVMIVVSILAAIGACGRPEKRVLNVYNWNEYIDPEVVTDFEEESGISVVYDVYSSNDELYARVRDGASGYDVVVPSDYMVSI